MSKAWAQAHGVTEPADYQEAREETYASRHANGTGPFVLEAFEPAAATVLVRNPDWWGRDGVPAQRRPRRPRPPRSRRREASPRCSRARSTLLQTAPYWALRPDPRQRLG